MRIGLLGGSFDPPHVGHLLAASDAFDALALDRVIFIPAAVQPLKGAQAAASPAQRLAMVRLLIESDERFDVNDLEIERGGVSYTVDTLTTMAGRWPAAALFLLVGADVLPAFAQWRQPERIVQLATVVVLERGVAAEGVTGFAGSTTAIATRRVDVSSTEIRRRVSDGKPIRGFVPQRVAEFIAAERLYR
jgi:nicotinate-nucleotide adenylyltransferase